MKEDLNILIINFTKHVWRMTNVDFNVEVLNNTIDKNIYGISQLTITNPLEVAVLQDTVIKNNSTLTIVNFNSTDLSTDELIDINLSINKCDALLIETNPYTFDSITAILNNANKKKFNIQDIAITIGDWVDFKNAKSYDNLFTFIEKRFETDDFDCNYRNQFDDFIPTILIDNNNFHKQQLTEFSKLTKTKIPTGIVIYDKLLVNIINKINNNLLKRNEFKGLLVHSKADLLKQCINDIPNAFGYIVNYDESFEDKLKDIKLPNNKLIINLFIEPNFDYSKLKLFIRDNYFKIKYIKVTTSEFNEESYLKTIEYFIQESINLIYKND